jgi:hypothetical protein
VRLAPHFPAGRILFTWLKKKKKENSSERRKEKNQRGRSGVKIKCIGNFFNFDFFKVHKCAPIFMKIAVVNLGKKWYNQKKIRLNPIKIKVLFFD